MTVQISSSAVVVHIVQEVFLVGVILKFYALQAVHNRLDLELELVKLLDCLAIVFHLGILQNTAKGEKMIDYLDSYKNSTS